MPLTLKQNDTRPVLVMELTESIDGGAAQPIDLTEADSVEFHMKQDTTVVERLGTVTNPTGGEISVTLQAADTAVAGTYDAEVEITWNPNEIETVPNDSNMQVVIVPDLA